MEKNIFALVTYFLKYILICEINKYIRIHIFETFDNVGQLLLGKIVSIYNPANSCDGE